MGSFSRWSWCALVAFFGLGVFQCAHATVHETEAEAWAACQSYAASREALTTDRRVIEAECVSDPVPPYTQYSNTRYGAIVCLQYGYPVGPNGLGVRAYDYCGGTQGLGIGDNAESRWAAKEFLSQPNLFNSVYNTSQRYAWTEEGPPPEDCSTREEFSSRTLRADTPNGSGQVCYQDCRYNVFVGYIGTYPAGYLEFDFVPLGTDCSEGDDDPVDDPTDDPVPPDEPLDLDPDDGGVDPGPDPGDGDPSSSGGGTCEAPPQCSGDSLQCNILFQTWSTRCAAEGEGDGLGEALEGVADGLGDISDGVDGLGNQLSDIFGDSEGDVSGPIGGLGQFNTGDKVFDSESLDSGGFGMSRACPAVLSTDISFSFFGNSYDLDFSMMCDLLELVGQVLVLLAAFISVRILLRSVN